jgi:hypothetical protein
LAGSDARDTVPDGQRRIRLGSGVLAGLFTLAIFYTLYFASALFIPIALALLLNLLLAPVVRGLRRHLHLPEGFGAGLVLVLLLVTVAASFYGLSGPATRWLAELPVAMVNVEQKLETLRRPVEEVQQAANKVADMATPDDESGEEQPVPVALQGPSLTQAFVGGAMTLAAGLIIIVALLFFLLASGDTLLRQAVSIAPRLRDKKRVVEIMRDIEDDISYYLLTVSIINAGLGCTVGVAMYLIGMRESDSVGRDGGIPELRALPRRGRRDQHRRPGRDPHLRDARAHPAAAARLSRADDPRGAVRHARPARPPPDPQPGRRLPGADRLDLALGDRRGPDGGTPARGVQDLLRSHRAASAGRDHARPLSRARDVRRVLPSARIGLVHAAAQRRLAAS